MHISKKYLRSSLQIFVSKWITRNFATGEVMVQRKQHHHAKCPNYGSEDDDLIHFFTCLAQNIKTLHNNLLNELRMWMYHFVVR